MISPFDIFQKPEDVKPYIDENEKLILPICDNIVFALGKSLDPLEEDFVSYDRNQATVLGIFVKQYQLFQSFVRASRDCDMSATIIFQRIIYEAYIKMQYLIKYGEDAQKEYRLCSYKNRYKFYQSNIEAPNDIARIAIEKFKADINNEEFSIEDIANAKNKKAFGGKSNLKLVEELTKKRHIHRSMVIYQMLYIQIGEKQDNSIYKKLRMPRLSIILRNESKFLQDNWLYRLSLCLNHHLYLLNGWNQ